ncbi:MAG: hypothetical protein IJR50_05100 [Treponema sp.]|nr:hypothetical protein [Treponema sp.]
MKKKLLSVLIVLCIMSEFCFAQKKKIDVDLTRMSSTMVYAEVFNMLIAPEYYDGKTIRMRGLFDIFEYERNGKPHRSFFCIVKDATACCAQGLEFSLADSYTYPNDYPARYTMITVTGRYRQYEQDGLTYILLVDCTIE